jgi:hypothetical protein
MHNFFIKRFFLFSFLMLNIENKSNCVAVPKQEKDHAEEVE